MLKQVLVASYIAGCLILVSAFAVADKNREFAVETWKQDRNPETAPSAVVSAPNVEIAKVEIKDNGINLVLELVASKGSVVRVKYAGKYDGKDYPVTGLPDFDTISLSKTDGYTIDCLYKKGGKAVKNERIILFKDGMRATVFHIGKEWSGLDATVVSVWDRQ
jgi:hypothetical protein